MIVGDTPVLLRDKETGNILIKTLDNVTDNENWVLDKETGMEKKSINYDVWNDYWIPAESIYRLHTTEDIIRLSSMVGSVDVTENHIFGEKRAIDIEKQDLIMNGKEFPIRNEDTLVGPQELKIWGLFFACGNFDNGIWQIKSKVVHPLSNAYRYLVQKENISFDLNPRKGYLSQQDSSSFRTKYQKLFLDPNGVKHIPIEILNAGHEDKMSFFNGVYLNGTLVCETKLENQGLVYVSESLLQHNFFNVENQSPVLEIFNLGKTDKYVYNIQTNGNFFAGVGKILV